MRTSARTTMSLLAGAALLVASCTGSGDSDSDGGGGEGASGAASATTEVSFCSSWTEMKQFVESDEPPTEAGLNDYLDSRDNAAGSLPDDLVDEWQNIVAWDDRMVEVLYSVNFQVAEITETIVAGAFGGVEQAQSAEDAQQLAFESIDRWSVTNCGETVADAFAFCDAWTDIYLNLSGLSRDRNQDPVHRQRELADWIAQAGTAVPPEIEDAWDSIADYHLARYDLLVTVDFEESLISDDLLADAFGSPEGAAKAKADAEAAVDVVEEWSKTGCGDFCVRGREAMERLGELGDQFDRRFTGPEGSYQLAYSQRLVATATALVPAEIQAAWNLAVAEVDDWLAWWESHDFDPEQLSQPEAVEKAVEIFRGAKYISFEMQDQEGGETDPWRAEIEAWRDGADPSAELQSRIVEMVQRPASERPGFGMTLFEVDQWMQGNCDNAGGPGVIEVEFPEITGAAGDHLVIAVGPVGSTYADLDNIEQFEVGTCDDINRDPWGIRAQEDEAGMSAVPDGRPLAARAEEAGEELCGFHGGHEPLDAGPHTLVVAQYDGLPSPHEAWGHGPLPDPTHCLAMDITISGDTHVQIPEVPLCDVPPPVIDPDDWRYVEPVSASSPGAGTLKVRIPDHRLPAELDQGGGGRGEYRLIVLPAGTTLNEVGREEVFPSGAGCVFLPDQNEAPDDLEARPVEIPIGSLPAAGSSSCLDPLWLNGVQPLPGSRPGPPAEDSTLPLTVLAAGGYDVRVWVFHGGAEHEPLCATFEVTVDGDTVVDAPELEECR